MKIELSRATVHGELARTVERISGQNLFSCYCCGNCTAGCPAAFAMDMGPHLVIRSLLLGLSSEVIASNAPRLCAICLQCSARCPKGIDIARVMDAVRAVALRDKGRTDLVRLAEIASGEPERLPQIALIGGFRKYLT